MTYNPIQMPDTWADRLADAYWSHSLAFTAKAARIGGMLLAIGICAAALAI
ncbi:hypothetical protein [Mesorhizobium sp. ES1-1]|uniref:hypothetical protein n=1 Tax=Mesorhizobium sp. ES1-1 TaxID=2876629 RepID=UPI001CCC733F|nr:hypothetical protein [Mesorhizobium sp. ES1-1]MBZ9674536.1 hypothetical protein [Mesorhizobium sp. ES1-1]